MYAILWYYMCIHITYIAIIIGNFLPLYRSFQSSRCWFEYIWMLAMYKGQYQHSGSNIVIRKLLKEISLKSKYYDLTNKLQREVSYIRYIL